ncbi:MAG: hypothetical protein GXO87_06230 [Chlorobi bacterium]|nr:hypothetical protein [Chlorobiota bacterium]
MKNLFSPYKQRSIDQIFNIRSGITLVLLAAAIVLFIFINSADAASDSSLLSAILYADLIILTIFTVYFQFQLKNYFSSSVKRITDLVGKLAQGNYEDRITFIKNNDELGVLMWQLDDLTDQMEAGIKEIATSIEFASKGKYKVNIIENRWKSGCAVY